MDTHLNVDSHQQKFLKPRKSVIGKLERSSFQSQRLSDVGVAFGQQITAKVGLKLPASQERIVEQTRWLYLRYVFVKLRQNKLPLRDLNLTKSSRARRAAALGLSNYGIGFGGLSQIVVSISEPPTASIEHDDFIDETNNNNNNNNEPDSETEFDADNEPLDDLRPPYLGPAHMRSRAALSVSQIDPKELSLLAARMDAMKENLSSIKRSSRQPNFSPTLSNKNALKTPNGRLDRDDNLAQTSTKSTTTIITNAATATRKFVMDPTINNQIFTVIMNTITELRHLKPEFYSDTIYEVIGIDKFSSLDSLLEVQKTICQEMTRSDISWDRIIALFSLFGAMSLDCVRLGNPEHVGPILDGFIGFVERDLALWISQQGGWESFLYKCRAGYRFGPIHQAMLLAAPLVLWLIFLAFK